MNKIVNVRDISISNDSPLAFIIGPNTLESREHALEMSSALVEIAVTLNISLIYKTSFDKANRSSLYGGRGVGFDVGLDILQEISDDLPTLTDVHEPWQCKPVAEVVDVLQIPAFLCRQTDLLVAAAETGKPINIKKGQFLSPHEMINAADKIASSGNDQILLCERGTTFGYNNLVVDMRSLSIMAKMGYPVVFDATHSIAQPGGLGDRSGGQREFVPVLARAAVSVGIAAIFIETHADPDQAPCEGQTMIPLRSLPGLLEHLIALDKLAKSLGSA